MSRIASAVAIAALVAAPCTAQSSSTLSEAEFLGAATDDHPALVARREVVAEAEARVGRARVLDDPQLDAVREAPSGAADQLDLTLSWQLPHPSRGPAVAARERDLEAARAQYAYDRLDLRLVLRESYAHWALAAELTNRLNVYVGTVRDLEQRQRRRAQSGEASGLEAGRLALAAAELESQQALVESQALEAAAIARGWNPAVGEDRRPLLPPLPALPSSAIEEGGHPRLIALDEEVEAARLGVRSEGRFIDLPELTAGWQRIDAEPVSIDGPILGLSWRLPLADRNQADRALAEARLEAASARREAEGRSIEAQRHGALAAYERLARAAGDSRNAVQANERIVAATTAAFQAGEASLTDLLDTVRSVITAESTTLRLHGAALGAHRRLERLVGRPLDLE